MSSQSDGSAMVPEDAPVVLVVDGNSLAHRAFHANARSGLRDGAGEPLWALQGLFSQIVRAVQRSRADAVVVGFDDPDASERRSRWPEYKAQRPERLASLDVQLRQAPDMLREVGLPVVVPTGLEADDVLASAARVAPSRGFRPVLVTSDRDAFALIDGSTRVLRLINGGAEGSPMLTPERLQILTGVLPHQYRDLAALRGDPSDNLPGVPGVGPVLAARLLTEFGTGQAVFEHAGSERCREVVGPALAARLATDQAEQAWRRNVEIMTMRTDVPVEWDPAGRLPLPASAVAGLCARLDLPARPVTAVLCDDPQDAPVEPPARDVGTYSDPRAIDLRGRRGSPAPAPRQLTLFSRTRLPSSWERRASQER